MMGNGTEAKDFASLIIPRANVCRKAKNSDLITSSCSTLDLSGLHLTDLPSSFFSAFPERFNDLLPEGKPLSDRTIRDLCGPSTSAGSDLPSRRRRKTRRERSFGRKLLEGEEKICPLTAITTTTPFSTTKSLRGSSGGPKKEKNTTIRDPEGGLKGIGDSVSKIVRGLEDPGSNRTNFQHPKGERINTFEDKRTKFNKRISKFEDEKKSLWECLTKELTNKLRERSKSVSSLKIEEEEEEKGEGRGREVKGGKEESKEEVLLSNITSTSTKTEGNPSEDSSTTDIPPPPPLPDFPFARFNVPTHSLSKPSFKHFHSEVLATKRPSNYSFTSSDDNSCSLQTVSTKLSPVLSPGKGLNKFPEKVNNGLHNSKTFGRKTESEKIDTKSRLDKSLNKEDNRRENSLCKSYREPQGSNTHFRRDFQYLSLPSYASRSPKSNQEKPVRKINSQFVYISDSESSDEEEEASRPTFRRTRPPRYQQLQAIRLCHNNLQEFPESLLHLSNLRSLNLCSNNINHLPANIHHISRLEILDLSHNRLKEVDVRGLKILRHLNVASNVIQKFPKLKRKTCLNFLDLTNNHIWNLTPLNDGMNFHDDDVGCHNNGSGEGLPNEEQPIILKMKQNRLTGGVTFASLQNVTELDVSDNGITSLEVSSLASLTSLKCSNNAIVTISVHGATLLSLAADKNRIKSIKVKCHPRRLSSLDLSRNCIGAVPPWLVSCNELEFCDVSNNGILSLPAYVTSGHLAELRVLKANHNNLKALSSTEGLAEHSLSAFERRRTCNLEVLSLHHNSVENLSTNFFQNFSRLRVLNVSSNLLKKLPELSSRRHQNQNDALVSPSLQELYAADNHLEDLAPIEICRGLKILHAPFNRIIALSQSFCWSCEFLEELVLSGNNMLVLPPAISRLRRLRVFKVHLNPIQELPKLSHLNNLKVIDASHCRLGKIDFGEIVGTSLTSLDIAFNPSLVVDRQQFSKCRSERSVSMVNTAGGRERLFPFQESKNSRRIPDGGSRNHQSHFNKNGSRPSSGNPKAQAEKETKTTPWKIGFCEAIGKEKSKLTVLQLRIADLCGNGRIGLVAVADGGESLESAANLLTAFPEAFHEEKLCSPDLNDALKYSLLSCLRKIILEEGSIPDGFCSAYLEVDGRRNDVFNNRSSVRTFSTERNNCSLRLCCFGDITAIVTTTEGSPLVVSCYSHNKSNDVSPPQCKRNGRCHIDRLSHLPNPHTALVRLGHHHQSLIIGSANLWELIDPEEVNKICQNIYDPALAAKRLLTLAQSYGSKESLSILIVYLPCGSPRNTYQYSSLSEKVNLEQKDFNPKVAPLHNYPCCPNRNKITPKNDREFFPEVNPRGVKDMEDLQRYPPSGQSDNEDSIVEVSQDEKKNEKKDEKRQDTDLCHLTDKKQFTYFNFPGPVHNFVPLPKENIECTVTEDSSGCFASSCDLITPPADFADADTESLGSDSGFSGNSGGKITHCNTDLIEKSSTISEVSEEQYRSWEYVIARNSRVLYLQELSSLKREKKESPCSSSVPNLVLESALEESRESNIDEETEGDTRTEESPTQHFYRNLFRKSRFARGAAKLLQSKINIGNTLKIGNIYKLRRKPCNFKRFGSLQNLKYYQNNRPRSISSPNLSEPDWTEAKVKEEMRETSAVDCVELESRMQQYWNTGVTCF